jgi:hypothetical protein
MNSWLSLSLRYRIESAFFASFAVIGIIVACIKNSSAPALFTVLPVPLVVLSVALNPANFRDGIVFTWAAQTPVAKCLLLAAAGSLCLSAILQTIALLARIAHVLRFT